MTRLSEQPSVQIEVIPATSEERPILANLLELYAHDFSEFYDLEGDRVVGHAASVVAK
jgi:hypothetical protein